MAKILNFERVAKDFQQNYPRAFNAELRNAISRAATYLRRTSIDTLYRSTTGKKSEFSSRIRVVKRPSPSDPVARVAFAYRPIPLAAFKPRTTAGAPSVYADIDTRQGKGTELIRKAFSPKGRRGANRVYERSILGGKRVGRNPYKSAQGVGLALLYPPIRDEMLAKTEDFLERTTAEGVTRRALNL